MNAVDRINVHLRGGLLIVLLLLSKDLSTLTGAEHSKVPPLPALGPTALCADAGDQRAYLRWNPQLEDARIVGWRVSQLAPEKKRVSAGLLSEPEFVVTNLVNGTEYAFEVFGVLQDGSTTPPSNSIPVVPHDVGVAKVVSLRRGSRFDAGAFTNVTVGEFAARIEFPDGQELVYDRLRPIDWKTRNGEHLIYPEHFGNGLDIGRFDERGLPTIIPPGGLERDRITLDEQAWSSTGPFKYHDVQFSHKHPCLTDPLTLPLDSPLHGDARVIWKAPSVDGNRVTFHYWQPLVLKGFRTWNYVLVWETWWPIDRDRHGTRYHGLARQIEVQMPEAWSEGYQVMLNNGFGPRGTRAGVTSYSSGFRKPAHEVVDFSGSGNRQVFFQSPKLPRAGKGYHPDMDCLQSSPLIFYDWPQGSLTISARSLYWHCANNSSSYVQEGADGVWPNLAWDLAIAGKRVAVDTVEYLYTADTSQPLPQRYLNARFEALGNVSRRMGLQDDIPTAAVNGSLGEVQRDGGPLAHAEKWIKRLQATGVDGYHIFHDFWHAVPVTVDAAYREDDSFDCNAEIKAMCGRFHDQGYRMGFWFRPEFVKTSLINALSRTIPTAETYYGYRECLYPDVVALLQARGIPLVREHPDWIRCQKDGSWPLNTPYQWVPMSLASGWWDQVMWPTLYTSRQMGFDWLLMDGGFGGMQGVYYQPAPAGKDRTAVACQPYWWRMFRALHHLGLRNFGECTLGWKGGFVNLTGPGDEYFIWMYQAGCIWGNENLATPRQLHQLYQLYNGSAGSKMMEADLAPVERYAREFFKKNGSPEWIELRELKATEPKAVTVSVAESPVAGGATRISAENQYTFSARLWSWTDAIWHYADDRAVVYPAYDRIDWSKTGGKP